MTRKARLAKSTVKIVSGKPKIRKPTAPRSQNSFVLDHINVKKKIPVATSMQPRHHAPALDGLRLSISFTLHLLVSASTRIRLAGCSLC